jgi:hypothetical protein
MVRARSLSSSSPFASLIVTVLLSGCGGGSSSPPPPPVTQSFATTTTVGQAVMLDVLSHVTDPDGMALSVVSATASNGGTVTVAANGEVTFTPAAGFSGSTMISYVVANTAGGQAGGQVSVTVTPVPHKVLIESAGALVLLANGSDHVFFIVPALRGVVLSPSRRYVAYVGETGDSRGLHIADLSLAAGVLNVPQGDRPIFTADESQVWLLQATPVTVSPLSFQLEFASLPSGALTTVEQFPGTCTPDSLAFAAADAQVFYGVFCTANTVASGVFSIDRAGPWNPQRITAPQTSAALTDTGLFAADAAGAHLIYELTDFTTAGDPTSVWSIAVGNPNAALMLAADSSLAFTGGATTGAISPDGRLAFIVVNRTTSLVSTPAAASVYQSGTFSSTVFRSDSQQAIIAQPLSTSAYVAQLSAVNLSAPGDTPTAIDTEYWLSRLIYTDDNHWLVYMHQDPSDSTGSTARLYAWNTAGGSVPVRLAPNIDEQVTSFAVGADSRTVAFSTIVNGAARVYLLDISAPAYALPVAISAIHAATLTSVDALY